MKRFPFVMAACAVVSTTVGAGSVPVRAARGMVASQNVIASTIGADVIKDGGTAIDAAVATAFALAVVHPTAGNIGGGGFLVYRPAAGEPVAYDFREVAPAKSWPTEQGKLPWKRLVEPSIGLARDGFVVTDGLAQSLKGELKTFAKFPASLAQFSKNGVPYEAGEMLKQPDLARTLERIATQGPAGFYEGETAVAIRSGLVAMRPNQAMRATAGRRNVYTDHMTTDYDSRSLSPAVADLFLVRRF